MGKKFKWRVAELKKGKGMGRVFVITKKFHDFETKKEAIAFKKKCKTTTENIIRVKWL